MLSVARVDAFFDALALASSASAGTSAGDFESRNRTDAAPASFLDAGAYRVDIDEPAWMQGVTQAAPPPLDEGLGVAGYLGDASAARAPRGLVARRDALTDRKKTITARQMCDDKDGSQFRRLGTARFG